jgi:hypothetical protein
MIIFVEGVDSRGFPDEYSNVDFVHFLWENIGVPGFRRHALTYLPEPSTGHGDVLASPGRLLCLRHYRVASEGWMTTSRCDGCVVAFRRHLRPHMDCVAPEEPCTCNVCARRPPTLRDMASLIVFGLTLNPERFEMTREVTHS